MTSPTYLIAGGTGFIGKHFIRQLPAGSNVVLLSRSVEKAKTVFRSIETSATLAGVHTWDPEQHLLPDVALQNASVLVNFAGESLAQGRWTKSKKQRILRSRVQGTRTLVNALNKVDHNVGTFVSISAVGYYGFHGDQELTEQSPAGGDFLADVVKQWEEELAAVPDSVRTIVPRLGVVLGSDGGALPQMALPFRFFAGGKIASGKQWVPWVHIQDCIQALQFLIDTESCEGVYNITSPLPCTNLELTKAISQALHRPALLPVPGPLLRLALGEFAAVLIQSQRVVPARLQETPEFDFRFHNIKDAMADLL